MQLLKRLSNWRRTRPGALSPFWNTIGNYLANGFESSKLRGLPPERKRELAQRLGKKVEGLLQSANPFIKLREEIVGTSVAYADMQVLCLRETEKAGCPQFESPYISGELNQYIRNCAPHNRDLKQYLLDLPDSTDEDLISYGNTSCAISLYYLTGLNLVRVEFKDWNSNPGKDWQKPLLMSLLIFYEKRYRDILGLPRLTPGPWDTLLYSTMMDLVMHGHEHPLDAWETKNNIPFAAAVSGSLTLPL